MRIIIMDYEINKQIEIATRLVKNMPPWKRNILVQSGQPTVRVPRTPLNFQATTVERREGNEDSPRP
jgi:hypothetical protein